MPPSKYFILYLLVVLAVTVTSVLKPTVMKKWSILLAIIICSALFIKAFHQSSLISILITRVNLCAWRLFCLKKNKHDFLLCVLSVKCITSVMTWSVSSLIKGSASTKTFSDVKTSRFWLARRVFLSKRWLVTIYCIGFEFNIGQIRTSLLVSFLFYFTLHWFVGCETGTPSKIKVRHNNRLH